MSDVSTVGIAALGLLAEASGRSVLLALVVGLVLVVLRVRSVTARHAAWSAVLGAMLALPVLAGLLPRLGIGVLPAEPGVPRADRAVVVAPRAPEIASAPRIESPMPPIGAHQPVGAASQSRPPSDSVRLPWPVWGPWVYLAGVAVMLGRLALGFALCRRMVAACGPTDNSDTKDVPGCPALAGRIRRAGVVVQTCRATSVPLTVGWLRRRILLPDGWRDWDPARLDAALAHELAHVERRDTLITLIGAINVCVYWFHPLAWLLRKRLTSLAEHACDDLAVSWTGQRAQYARHLLDFARGLAGERARLAGVPALSMADGGDLRSRIGAILDRDRRASRPLGRRQVIGIALAGALVVLPLATVELQRRVRAASVETPVADQDERNAVNTADTRVLHGIVLGPDGRPFVGARLFVPYENSRGHAYLDRAMSGPDGRFRFTVTRGEFRDVSYEPLRNLHVVAWSRGLGIGWDHVGQVDGQPAPDRDLTLRLVNDVPVEGRILTLEGKPVAGARIKIDFIQCFRGGDMTEALQAIRNGAAPTTTSDLGFGPPPGQPEPTTTDDQGRFRITGAGGERLLRLGVEGPGIESNSVHVATRRPEPNGSKVLARYPTGLALYAAHFEHFARPSRLIRGVVREKGTGQPVAGALVWAPNSSLDRPRTDAQGRYVLTGYPRSKDYTIQVTPADGQPCFAAQRKVSDTAGIGPLIIDFELVRGILVRGRLTDGETGQPHKGEVQYYPVQTNSRADDLGFPVYFHSAARCISDDQGNYAVPVLPGPGLLAAAAWGGQHDRYRLARIDRDELKRIAPNAPAANINIMAPVAPGGPLLISNFNEIRLIRPGDNEAGPIRQDITLRVGRTIAARVIGPNGKPIAGARILGATSHAFDMVSANAAGEFRIVALDPDRKRNLNISEPTGKLGLFTAIAGDVAGPLTIHLQPTGSATGRIVDEAGQPYRNRPIVFQREGYSGPGDLATRTDDQGVFQIKGLVPGQPYRPGAPSGTGPGPRFDVVKVAPGEEKDLGLARVQP